MEEEAEDTIKWAREALESGNPLKVMKGQEKLFKAFLSKGDE